MNQRGEALSRTIQISSGATLAGLVSHYASFYIEGTPLWTNQIAEWIMARTPSRFAVTILDRLGEWAKPSAVTGALAALGLCLFAARWAGGRARDQLAAWTTGITGVITLYALAWWCGYSSLAGGLAFCIPALAIAAWVPRTTTDNAGFSQERREWFEQTVKLAVPAVMSAGVAAVAAESFLRERSLERQAATPADLFPFLPPLDRAAFGKGLVRKEVTPVREFYGMSKDTVDPAINTATWRLRLTMDGKLVRSYSFRELLAMPRDLRYVTLRCISNTLDSDLMGTAEWTGIRLSQLLEREALPPNIVETAFIGVEGHDDSLRIEYAYSDEVMLAVGMNGKTLSRTHGFPVRLLAPRYFGCRNVKWLGEIRFVSKPYFGTWQRLGYTSEPIVQIASHIDGMRRDGGLLEFGGVSHAGSRGIRAVRVRADNGAWQSARLEPALSPYTWTRWTAQLRAQASSRIEANAQDGNGTWQQLLEGNPFPDGPSGPTIVIARV